MGKVRAVVCLLIVAALVLGLPGGSTFAGDEFSDFSDLELPPQGHPKIESRLDRLMRAESGDDVPAFSEQRLIQAEDGRVRVIVEVSEGREGEVINKAQALGGKFETSYRNLLQVLMPVPNIEDLADDANVKLVRLPLDYVPAAVGEGVGLINSGAWNTAGFTGTGTKVGIIDGGFSGYEALLGTELPSSDNVTTYWAPSREGPGSSAHGTACAEIIYDIAPDAEFYLANFASAVEWANAVDWLIDQGVDVISHSIGWLNAGPGDGTGPVCEAVTSTRDAGILWCQSAGNHAQKHWSGIWQSTDGDNFHDFSTNPLHEGQTIYLEAGETIAAYLKWRDDWGTSAIDYDLWLIKEGATPDLVDVSENRQDGQGGNDYPIERLVYTALNAGDYAIAIWNHSGSVSGDFHLVCSTHDLQYQVAAGSIYGQPADSSDALTVGAVLWNNLGTIAAFSSQGPREGGLIKPDMVAPSDVSSAALGEGFSGTSASAPHVAGAALIAKQRYSSYSPAQIQAFLEGRAIDLGSIDKDNLYGWGMLDLGVPPAPPEALFAAVEPISGVAPLTVSFIDQSTGEITSWSWSFGDQGTSTEQNPSHQYTLADTHTVSLTVTGPDGTSTKTIDNYITVTPGPLDSGWMVTSPAPAYVQTEANQQFTLTAYDQYNNEITTGLDMSWSVVNGGGTIDQNGLFTAGQTRGVFSNTVRVDVSYNGESKVGTATVIVGNTITLRATLQGDARTFEGMDVPLTLRLYDQEVTSSNILTLSPVETFATADWNIDIYDRDPGTKVLSCNVSALPTGTYNVTLYTPHCLVNLNNGVNIAQGITLDMGALKEGDAKDITESSKTVDSTDFTRFSLSYELAEGETGYNPLADFDRSGTVDIGDFSLLYTNYGETSPQTVSS
ncbi:MAG: S8 family serine peptidase [Chloroflexota bacterium]